MTPRERVLKALRHEEPDRIPLNIYPGGGGFSTQHDWVKVDVKKKFMDYLGLSNIESVYQRLGIDIRVVEAGSFRNYRDENKRPFPFEGLEKIDVENANIRTLDNVYCPRWDELWVWKPEELHKRLEEIKKLPDEYAIAVNAAGPTFFEYTRGIRGMEKFMMDLVLNPEFAVELMRRVMNLYLEWSKAILTEIGDKVDIVIGGDDFGTQKGTFISPKIFRELVKPLMKEFCSVIKSFTDAYILYHSCGSVYEIIPDLIEAGIEILNPVQVQATGMDIRRLKEEFGDKLSFDGAIDGQYLLPHGSIGEIKKAVVDTFKVLGKGGGYLMAPTHRIQADTSPENIVILYDTAINECRY